MAIRQRGCGGQVAAPLFRFIAAVIVGLICLHSGMADAATPAVSMQGMWIVRDAIATPSLVREVITFAEKYGFTDLFVQVRGRGDAFYASSIVPGPERFPDIPGRFDPLAAVIEQAHSRGMKVHAWCNLYLSVDLSGKAANPRHILNTHPEWFAYSNKGVRMTEERRTVLTGKGIEGLFLSPGSDEAAVHLAEVIAEVVDRYAVDGIHLDYIRYPGREYDFSPAIRNRFKALHGADPVDIVLRGNTTDPTGRLLRAWTEYRAITIDDRLRFIGKRLAECRRKVSLSAAVKADVDEAYYAFGQDWTGWIEHDLVDFVIVMSYDRDTARMTERLREGARRADRGRIIGGIGTYLIEPSEAAKQANAIRSLGLAGICWFSSNVFREDPSYAPKLQKAGSFSKSTPNDR